MPIVVQQPFRNLSAGLEIPEQSLVVLTGSNNTGKSAILQYLNVQSELRDRSDYVSPRRFDATNQVAIAFNNDEELLALWNQRKQFNPAASEFTAPDATRELVSLPDDDRERIIAWHNEFFGELVVEPSNPKARYSPPRIAVDGRLVSEQGSGSRAVLAVLVPLLHPDRPVILIDEPEIGLEPQVQKRLAEMIRRVSAGELPDLPAKQVYVATHSHLFLDRVELQNNFIVTKDPQGSAQIRQVERDDELVSLVYHLLGNSPNDLFFPSNILVVEGPSDQIFFRRLLELVGAKSIAAHYSGGGDNVEHALPAIDQMLSTQAYIPWYRDRLCVVVDSDIDPARLDEWRDFLGDDGSRVRQLGRDAIEHYYPVHRLAELSGLPEDAVAPAVTAFLGAIRAGARTAPLGTFEGSKRQLATELAALLDEADLARIDAEINQVLEVVQERRLAV